MSLSSGLLRGVEYIQYQIIYCCRVQLSDLQQCDYRYATTIHFYKNKMHVILMHNDVLCTIIAFHHRHCKMKQTAVILVTLLSTVCIEGILLYEIL